MTKPPLPQLPDLPEDTPRKALPEMPSGYVKPTWDDLAEPPCLVMHVKDGYPAWVPATIAYFDWLGRDSKGKSRQDPKVTVRLPLGGLMEITNLKAIAIPGTPKAGQEGQRRHG